MLLENPPPNPVIAVVIGQGTYSAFQIKAFFEDKAGLVWVADSTHLPAESPATLVSRLGNFVDTHSKKPEDVAEELGSLSVSGIIAFADPQLPIAASLAELLGLSFNTPEVVAGLTDKLIQRERLSEAGIWTPDHCVIDLAKDSGAVADFRQTGLGNLPEGTLPGYPAVLKPRIGTNSSNTFLITDEACLASTCSGLVASGFAEQFIIEAFIGDHSSARGSSASADYVSVESFVDSGAVVHLGITGRFPAAPPFRGSGGFFPADLGAHLERDVYRLTEQSLAALKVRSGICHTEIKLTAEGPRLLEVNGRLGGDTEVLVRLSTGNSIVPYLVSNIVSGKSGAATSDFVTKRVAFRIAVQPPIEATRLDAISGLDKAAALPGVENVVLNKAVGTELDYREGAMSQIYSVSGSADDYDKMLALRQRVIDSVEMKFS